MVIFVLSSGSTKNFEIHFRIDLVFGICSSDRLGQLKEDTGGTFDVMPHSTAFSILQGKLAKTLKPSTLFG